MKVFKKVFVIVILYCFYVFISCGNNKNDLSFFKLKKELLLKDSVYLFFRGTDTKEGFYAKDFNINDSLSSHVGIGVYENYWKIYNVLDYKDGFSDLRSESFEDFFSFKKEKVIYGSVWAILDLDSIDVKKIKENILIYKNKKITFDKTFSLLDSTKLYCSEFICNLLYETNSSKFNFKLNKRGFSSKSIYGIYFQKDTLNYYPVDIFQYNNNIKKIKEWRY